MDENKNNKKMTPEEELDLLLEKFLAEEDPILPPESSVTADGADAYLTEDNFDDEEEELIIWHGPERTAEPDLQIEIVSTSTGKCYITQICLFGFIVYSISRILYTESYSRKRYTFI